MGTEVPQSHQIVRLGPSGSRTQYYVGPREESGREWNPASLALFIQVVFHSIEHIISCPSQGVFEHRQNGHLWILRPTSRGYQTAGLTDDLVGDLELLDRTVWTGSNVIDRGWEYALREFESLSARKWRSSHRT